MWDKALDATDCTTQKRRTKALQCTAEHLWARSDGGSNNPENIVAACRYCNTTRHKCKKPRSPESHRAHVRRRLNQGRWFSS
ncbi:HNH endonuclease [Rhodobacteraceae bacterium M385]|nr:HNH endonuclease [Rhodobacteraceae bacterium M385]